MDSASRIRSAPRTGDGRAALSGASPTALSGDCVKASAAEIESAIGTLTKLLLGLARGADPSPSVQPDSPERWLTLQDGAKHIGGSVDTIERWGREGLLRIGRVGRFKRVRASDLDAALLRVSDEQVDHGEQDRMSARVMQLLGRGA